MIKENNCKEDKQMKKKRILVTGGAGFVGHHLCLTLLDQGHSVICLDDLSSGSKSNLIKHENFSFLQSDAIHPIEIDGGLDWIFHLACPASPVHYQVDPIKTIKTSIFGMINVLDLAKEKSARTLFSSTSEIYGDPSVHPQNEKYWGNVNPIGPRSCYDEGKRAAETLCFDYRRQHGIDVRVVRIFNTYGPKMRDDDGRVVSNFIVQALRGDPITVYGEGRQTRSFCYIDDLIEGILAAMNVETLDVPINLGNPDEFKIEQLAQKVISMTGSRSEIIRKPLPQDDPQRRMPDISRAIDLLGWTPKISLEDGLKSTIKYFMGDKK